MSGQVRSFPASEIQFPRPRLRLVLGKLNYLGLETHRTALGWILASQKKPVFSLWVKACQLSDSDS